MLKIFNEFLGTFLFLVRKGKCLVLKKKSEHRWVCSFGGELFEFGDQCMKSWEAWPWFLLEDKIICLLHTCFQQGVNQPDNTLTPQPFASFPSSHVILKTLFCSLSSEMSTRERGQVWGHTPRGWRQARQIRSTGSCSGDIVISKPSLGYKETPWLCLKSTHTQLTVGKIKN